MAGEFISISTEWVATAVALMLFVGVIYFITRKSKPQCVQPDIPEGYVSQWGPKRVEHQVTLNINVNLKPEKVWSGIFKEFKFKDAFKEFDLSHVKEEEEV